MIQTLQLPNKKTSAQPALLSVDQLSEALKDKKGVVWVDMIVADPREAESIMLNVFSFHPLAIEDALRESHIPTMNDWLEYLYLAVHAAPPFDVEQKDLETTELDIFFGPNYLVTYHKDPIPALQRVWEYYQRGGYLNSHTAGGMLYNLLDEIALDYTTLMGKLDDEIEILQQDVLNESNYQNLMYSILAIRNALSELRRVIAPQAELLNRLARGGHPLLQKADLFFYRDVYDHFARLHQEVENLRDMSSVSLEVYLSVINNRMNNIMKTLTVITTLFMPLSFLTGFFGMNFFEPVFANAWTSRPALWITLVIMTLLPAAMFLWMRKRTWL
jgi:magnesium transporter